MRALKCLFAILVLCITLTSIVGISVNASTIKFGTDNIDKYYFRLKNSLQYPFEKIDTMIINLDIENTSDYCKGAVSFFSGIDTFIYKEFGTANTGLDNIINEKGSIKITFDDFNFTDNLPYVDIYVSELSGDISINSIDFYGDSGDSYYYTLYGSDEEQIEENSDVPMVFNFIKSSIFRNSVDIAQDDDTTTTTNNIYFSVRGDIQENPITPYIKYDSISLINYPQIFNFYTAIADIKGTYTLFNNKCMQADARKTIFSIKTTAGGGDFSIENIRNNSFIYAVYAIDKSSSYSDDDAMAVTISNKEYTMKIPPAQTMSINDYLNAIYGSMTVDKILHSTFSDEQIAKMTRKELYQIRQLIATQIEKTFGSVDTVMNELDKMVKTTINSELSVNSIYVSAFLPEDIRKVAELKFPLAEMTDFSFVAQESGISLIEAYCASTKNKTIYVSSIADGEIIYDSFKYSEYASNKPSSNTGSSSSKPTNKPTDNSSNSSSSINKNDSNISSDKNTLNSSIVSSELEKYSKEASVDSSLNNSNTVKVDNDDSDNKIDKNSSFYNNTSDKMIDGNPSTKDRGIAGVIALGLISIVIGCSIKKKI